MPVTFTPFPEEAKAIQLTTTVSRWTQGPETQLIVWLAMPYAGDVLEIGCNNGLTTRELALNRPQSKVYGLDYVGMDVTMVPQQRGEKPWHEFGKWCQDIPNVTLLNMDSRKITYAAICPGVRVVFIDGDHSYEGVKADTELAIAHLKSVGGGLIMWHDYYEGSPDWCGVKRYIDAEIAPHYDMRHYEHSWVVATEVR